MGTADVAHAALAIHTEVHVRNVTVADVGARHRAALYTQHPATQHRQTLRRIETLPTQQRALTLTIKKSLPGVPFSMMREPIG
jgi:hypothetical protein